MKQKNTKAAVWVLFVTIALLVVTLPYPVQADTSGPNYPWSGINQTGVGTEAWGTPANIYGDDAAYAAVTLNQDAISNYLQGTDFRFNIPLEASITGIQVTIERYSPGNNPRVRDQVVSLVKGGTITAVNKAITANWPQTPNGTTYGSATDLWGESWTPADINSASFGVAIAARNPNKETRTAYVDYIRIAITYKLNSATSVDCGDGIPVVLLGLPITCEASVTRSGGTSTPSGTINWTTDSAGIFSPETCILAGTGGTATCSVSYTPTTSGDGTHLITATYPGDTNFNGSSESQTVTISVNQPPVIISNGGGDTAAITNPENTTAVTTVVATDPEGGTVTYSISGGADAAKFTIGSSSGILSFISPQNYEVPTDAGVNNVYDVIVQVADTGLLTDNQAIALTVTGVNEAPSITEGASVSVNMSVDSSPNPFSLTLNATDPDAGSTLTWSISAAAEHGQAIATGTGSSKAITYTPVVNYSGSDSFTVKVTDNLSLFDTIVVYVEIMPVANIYYVDNTNPASSDSNLGKNPALPLKTIGRGAAVARAGDTVHVLAGTYAETVWINTYSGIAGNPITFHASPGVTVNGNGNPSSGSAFYIVSRSYIVIDGFNIVDTAFTGIHALYSDHLTISNNHISGAGSNVSGAHRQGIYLELTTNSLITHNVTNDNSCIGIRLSHSSNNNTISNNVSSGNYSVPGGTQDAAGIELDDSDSNLIIHNITYGNEDTGINLYKTVGDGSNFNKVIGNLTYGNGDHGIDNNSSSGNSMVGNTVHGNYTSGINLELNSGDAIVKNNIIMNNGINPVEGKPGELYVDGDSVGGTIVDYNLYYRTGGSYLIRWNSVSYLTLSAFQADFPAQEVHGLEANPLFVNPAPRVDARPAVPIWGNYRLLPLSPAIDSADSSAPFHPNTDIAGLARFDDPDVPNSGAGPRKYDDRGAYEKQSGSSTGGNVFLPLVIK